MEDVEARDAEGLQRERWIHGRKARTHAEWEWRGCVQHTSSHDLL